MISQPSAFWGVTVPTEVSAGYNRGPYWIIRVSHKETICIVNGSLHNCLPFCFRESLSHEDMNIQESSEVRASLWSPLMYFSGSSEQFPKSLFIWRWSCIGKGTCILPELPVKPQLMSWRGQHFGAQGGPGYRNEDPCEFEEGQLGGVSPLVP